MSGSTLDNIDWGEVDRKLAKAKAADLFAWSEQEKKILIRAKRNGFSGADICRSGVLPNKTFDAIYAKITRMKNNEEL